jgi:hypothetical protein
MIDPVSPPTIQRETPCLNRCRAFGCILSTAPKIGNRFWAERKMDLSSSSALSRQGRRLLQVGAGLLIFSSLEGFAIPYAAAPRLGLSAHTLSGLQSVLLLALGITR